MFANKLFGPIKQWGYLVKDLDEAMDCWVNQLGVGPFWGYRNVPVTAYYQGQETQVVMDVALGYQNGVQIELIHQTNDVLSPYSDFYKTDKKQFLHQVAYHAPDIDKAIAIAKSVGMKEVGSIKTMLETRYVYMASPAMDGLVIELMEVDDGTIADFDNCAQEAAIWDGSDPFRLISL
ncbi:MAG: VOC family protein [Pseudomonadales bacterium]